jgi:hypothetical protein
LAEAIREQALEHFSPGQLYELTLKLSTWTVNKSLTALRADAAIDEERLTPFDFDEHGTLVLHTA